MKRYFLVVYHINVPVEQAEYITNGKYPNKAELIEFVKARHPARAGDADFQISNIIELSKSDYEDWIGQEHEETAVTPALGDIYNHESMD